MQGSCTVHCPELQIINVTVCISIETCAIGNILPNYKLVRHMCLSGRTDFFDPRWHWGEGHSQVLFNRESWPPVVLHLNQSRERQLTQVSSGEKKKFLNRVVGDVWVLWCRSQPKLIQWELTKFEFQCAVHTELCTLLSLFHRELFCWGFLVEWVSDPVIVLDVSHTWKIALKPLF